MGLPAQLLQGSSLLNEGRLDAAETLVRGYLRQNGPHVEGMRLLVQIAIRRDVLDDAELLLEDVVQRAPDQHWDRVLPGKVLRVQHEDVANDLEGSVRRMLDFCGLEFEASCLEFYKTRRSIRTLSSEQVRRPISREGLDHWRNYEPWLGPLKAALGPLAETTAGARVAASQRS